MAKKKEEIIEIVRHSYKDEVMGHILYENLAKVESEGEVKKVLKRLSEIERSHAEFWKKMAEARNIKLSGLGLLEKIRLKFYVFTRRIFGTMLIIKLLEREERDDIKKYKALLSRRDITLAEKKELEKILVDEIVHEEMLSITEAKAKDIGDFVYGISDGLIEVLAAVSGLAGVLVNPLLIAIGGLIVGLSGTLSMSIGAYLSTKSKVEIANAKRRKVEVQKEVDSKIVLENLKRSLESLGLKAKDAEAIAPRLYNVAEDIIAPVSFESPLKSAGITAASYIIGAIIPVLPFIIGLSGIMGLIISYLVTGLSTLVIGYIIGLLSESNPTRKGLEMAGLAIGAAIVTHIIGVLASTIIPASIS